MFGAEFTSAFKAGVIEASNAGDGPPRVYAWLDNLLALMATHDQTETLQSLGAVQLAVDAIPQQDAKECEEILQGMGFFLGVEENKIEEREEILQKEKSRMAENEFRVNSDLDLYRKTFGGPFSTALSKMAEKSRWLDGGAGEAKAMIEFLSTGGEGECVATGFKIPIQAASSVEEATSKFKGRFRYVDGKYFGDMSDMDLGGAGFDLITDLNGVIYYTRTLLEDVRRYLQLLNVGGLLVFTTVHIEIDMPNAVSMTGSGPAMARWVSNIGGVKVRLNEKDGYYEVYKTAAEIEIPEIVLIHYETQKSQNDPIRKYTTEHTLPNPVVRTD